LPVPFVFAAFAKTSATLVTLAVVIRDAKLLGERFNMTVIASPRAPIADDTTGQSIDTRGRVLEPVDGQRVRDDRSI